MHKTTWTAAAIAAVTATATATAAASPGRPVAHAAAKTLHLVETHEVSRQLDLGPKGFSAGDRQTIHSVILTRHGRRAGRLDDDCAITEAGSRPEAVCTFVLTLRHGQLTGAFAQSLTGEAPKRQAITGGTGRYVGTRGELRAASEGKRTAFTVVLRSR